MKIHLIKSKTGSLFLVFAMLAFPGLGPIAPTPAQADPLGSQWNGCEYDNPATPRIECEWKFEWRRTTARSNVFNAYWRHRIYGRFQGKIRIWVSGSKVTVSRPALGGGPPCTYTGKYERADRTQGRSARAYGKMTCGSYTGPWRAMIH